MPNKKYYIKQILDFKVHAFLILIINLEKFNDFIDFIKFINYVNFIISLQIY